MKKFLIVAAYVSLLMIAVLNCEEAGKKEAQQPKDQAVTEQPAAIAEQPQAQVAETTPAETTQEPAKTEDIAANTKGLKDANTKEVASAEPVTQKAGAPLQGRAVSLNSLVTGGSGIVSRAEAIALADKGQPIVFLSGNKVYFVYNADGTYAGSLLAKYAGSEKIGIVGKTKVVKGINIIIQEMIESM